MFSNDLLLWFATFMLQVTLLSSLGLATLFVLRRHSVVCHHIAAITLLWMVLALPSSWYLQRAGFAVITIAQRNLPVSHIEAEPMNATRLLPASEHADFDTRQSSSHGIAATLVQPESDTQPQVSATRWMTQPLSAEPHSDGPAGQVQGPNTGLERSPSIGSGVFASEALAALGDANSAIAPSTTSKRILAFALLLWGSGSCLLLIRALVAWRKLTRLINHAHPTLSAELLQAYRQACDAIGCHPNKTRLLLSHEAPMPMVTGVFRPVILLPAELLRQVSTAQVMEILTHELAHVVRRDQAYLLLKQVAEVIFWPHPLVHLVAYKMMQASEEISDNFVLMSKSEHTYTRTLLRVAELTAHKQAMLGGIGVVGLRWSLRQRIEGLLDNRRSTATRLNRAWKPTVVALAIGFGSVLLLTARLTTESALADTPAGQETDTDPSRVAQAPGEWLRGTGEQLELRLRGRLTSDDGRPLIEPKVIVQSYGSLPIEAEVINDRYEVWIPAKYLASSSFACTITGTTANGDVATKSISLSELRQTLEQAIDLQFAVPTRQALVHVQFEGNPVPNAQLRVRTKHPEGDRDFTAEADANGDAVLKLFQNEKITSLTAWTSEGLLGGYQLWRAPERNALADRFNVELVPCKTRMIRVVDTAGDPVTGVLLAIESATPPPDFNYFGRPDNDVVTSNAEGMASYGWFPNIPEAHHYAEVLDNADWKLLSQRNLPEAVEVVVGKPVPRTQVTGTVSGGGQSVAGTVVEAYSFQGEGEDRSDIQFAIADSQGQFVFDAIPTSTYSLFVLDEQRVSEPVIFTPIDRDSGEQVSPSLALSEGELVTVQVTSGKDRTPVAGQSITLASEIPYSWKENGEKRNGVTARTIVLTTDNQGLATGVVPVGSLTARINTPAWRSEVEIDIERNGENRIVLHRENDVATEYVGQLVSPPFNNIDLTKISLAISAVDGENVERFVPTVDASGSFRFSSKASALAMMAYSEDGTYSAAAIVPNLEQPIELAMAPSVYLIGQLLNADGEPIKNHPLVAEPRLSHQSQIKKVTNNSFMSGRKIDGVTDANGAYRLGPLPRLTRIRLTCDPLSPPSVEDGRHYLGEYYFEIDEQPRPVVVHRIGSSSSTTAKVSTEQRWNSLLRDARLGGYHALAILSDTANEAATKFVRQNLLDYDENVHVSHYMQLWLSAGENASKQTLEFIQQQQWPRPAAGEVAVVALDANGVELGREMIKIASPAAPQSTAAFLLEHLPPEVDSRQKWNEAFALARQTDRRVWVRISQRYCNPCHLLNRWIDDHKEILDKDFVMLKVDNVRDQFGVELAQEITGGRNYGVPFFAFYDAEETKLIDSCDTNGNIGFMSGFEAKRHFRRMLELARKSLTDADIEQLLSSLDD